MLKETNPIIPLDYPDPDVEDDTVTFYYDKDGEWISSTLMSNGYR